MPGAAQAREASRSPGSTPPATAACSGMRPQWGKQCGERHFGSSSVTRVAGVCGEHILRRCFPPFPAHKGEPPLLGAVPDCSSPREGKGGHRGAGSWDHVWQEALWSCLLGEALGDSTFGIAKYGVTPTALQRGDDTPISVPGLLGNVWEVFLSSCRLP